MRKHSFTFMKTTLAIFLLMITSVLQAAHTPNGFSITRGVNISHWLSQVPERGFPHHDIMYTELDAAFLASAGFDHVRLPIDEEQLWDEAGKPIEARWDRLLRGINASLRHDLGVIIDLHIVRSHHFNAAHDGGAANTLFEDPGAQAQFLELWEEISRRLRHFPVDQLAYEIMNEAVAEDPEDWNQLLANAHALLRKLEPERTIVMGSNTWQRPETFPDLRVPANDPNIILSLHTYTPMLITHYKASWVPIRSYDGPVQYPGISVDEAYAKSHYSEEIVEAVREMGGFEEHNRDSIAQELTPAIERAKELGLSLYCGEFGCLPTSGRENRLQYYRDITSIFAELDIAYTAWDYRGSFSLIDNQTLEVDHELVDILAGKRTD